MLLKKKVLKEEETKELKVDTKKNNNFLRFFLLKRFWFVLLASLAGIFLFLYFFLSFFTTSSEGTLEYHFSKDINQLNFYISAAQIDFIAWDKDFVKINYELKDSASTLDQLEVVESSGERSWNFFWKKDFSLLNESLTIPSFEIYIPNRGSQSLSFDVLYGDLSFSDFHDKEIKGSLIVGDISLKDVVSLYGDIQLGWGTLDTYGKIKNKEWNASTGFSGMIPLEEGRALNLSTFMGALD